jgi:hypothetical protein
MGQAHASRDDAGENPANESAGLACACRGLNHQGRIKVIANTVTRRLIG